MTNPVPHNTNQAELDNNQIREKLAPFGNAAQIVGTKRVELYDAVRALLAAEIRAARLDEATRAREVAFNHYTDSGHAVALILSARIATLTREDDNA